MSIQRSNIRSFTQIPNDVIYLRLSPAALVVYIAAMSQRDSFEFSIGFFQGATSVSSRNTISRAIEELRDVGLVSGSFRGGLVFYDVPQSQCSKNEQRNVQKMSNARGSVAQNLTLECPKNEQASLYYNTINTIKKEEEEEDQQFSEKEQEFAAIATAPVGACPITHDPAVLPAGVLFTDRSLQYNAGNVRAIVDFSDPSVAQLRERVARVLWCESVYADVIDRATAAIVCRFDGASVQGYRRMRSDIESESQRSGRGAWIYLASRIRSLYEQSGWAWSDAYRHVYEPRPKIDAQTIKQREEMAEQQRLRDDLVAAERYGFSASTSLADATAVLTNLGCDNARAVALELLGAIKFAARQKTNCAIV